MGGDQGPAPVDERVVRGEEIGDVAAFLVGHGMGLGDLVRRGHRAGCQLQPSARVWTFINFNPDY